MIIYYILDTFASKGKTVELFRFKNTSNLTHEFCMTVFTKKLNKIFLLKLPYKHLCGKYDAFSRKMVRFFPKNETLRSKSVKDVSILQQINRFLYDKEFKSIKYKICLLKILKLLNI